MRIVMGVLCAAGFVATFAGLSAFSDAWSQLQHAPAIVAAPQLIMIELVIGFGALVATTAGGLCALLGRVRS